MKREYLQKALLLVPVIMIMFLFTGCFVAYPTPDKEIIKEGMFGGEWPSGLPAPTFIKKIKLRGSMNFTPQNVNSAAFYFENVKKEEINAYVDALKSKGFNVQGVSYTYSSGFNNDRLIDEYEATKDRFRMKVSAFDRRPDGYFVISISGLTTDEFKALNCPTLAEEESQLSSGQRTQKRYIEDITAVLIGSPQKSITDNNGKWIDRIPAPDFIQNLDVGQEKPHAYDSNDSVILKFRDITVTALENYLVTLAKNGFTVYNTAIYQGFEGINPNGALAILQMESGLIPAKRFARSWPGGFISAVKDSMIIDVTEIGERSNSRNAFAALLTKAEYQSKMENYNLSEQTGKLPNKFDVTIVLRGLSQLEKDKLIGFSAR